MSAKRRTSGETKSSRKRAARAPSGDGDGESFEPSPWLDMGTAKPLHMNAAAVAHWMSDAGGKAAAKRGGEMDQLRLLGSLDLTFALPSSRVSDEMLAEMLGLLEKPGRSRNAEPKWYKHRGSKLADPPQETWDKTSGEFVGQGFVSPSLLLQTIFDGNLLCDQEWATEVLEAIGLLTTPDGMLWGCPLLRAVIPPPASLRAVANEWRDKGKKPKPSAAAPGPASKKRKAGDSPSSSADARGGGGGGDSLDLTVHIYVSRLLLYLIAHPSIRVLLAHLSPPEGGGVRQPLDALPSHPQCFLSHGGANCSPFSLEGVLKACEHRGYRAAAQPRGVALPLKQYQAQALAWMKDMESLPRGLNGLFWEERAFADGGSYYYSPQLGEMRLEAPPVMHGGLLCDEMGLGKTLELVSLIVDTLEEPMPPPDEPSMIASRATLIVVPVPLVSQWMAEIAKSVGAGSALTYRKYTIDDLIKRDGQARQRAAALAAHDIVITTYPAMDKCAAALPHIAWKRVVLDEMQEVRSSTTE